MKDDWILLLSWLRAETVWQFQFYREMDEK